MNWSKVDRPLLITVGILILLGTIMVYSASAFWADAQFQDSSRYLRKQVYHVALAISMILLVIRIDYRWYRPFMKIALLCGLALLVFVVLSGRITDQYTASRWLSIFGLSLQPSEIMKYVLIFYMADTLSRKKEVMNSFVNGFLPLVIILSATCFLILIEPHLSTAFIIFVTLFFMFFVAKIPLRFLVVLLLGFGAMAVTAIATKPYMQQRIIHFMNPEADVQGKGYQIQQSLIGLGNGGIFGAGLGAGKQKLLYLPEAYTDFIFAIIGEELGLLGTLLVLTLFCVILIRGIHIAKHIHDDYGFLLTVGLTFSLVIPAIINMAVVCGLAPTTGLPIPFVSYGGTSLIFSSVAIGVLLNISSQVEKSLKEQKFAPLEQGGRGTKKKRQKTAPRKKPVKMRARVPR